MFSTLLTTPHAPLKLLMSLLAEVTSKLLQQGDNK